MVNPITCAPSTPIKKKVKENVQRLVNNAANATEDLTDLNSGISKQRPKKQGLSYVLNSLIDGLRQVARTKTIRVHLVEGCTRLERSSWKTGLRGKLRNVVEE